MKEQRYEDFAERVHDKGFMSQVLTLGHFELTFDCALKCGFCYCTPYMTPAHTRNELSTSEVKAILDQAAAAGCLWMTFSGGDPFMRSDFREIYDHARELGLIVTIYCSGLIMTDEWVEHLRKHPPFSLELPLYGVTAETHEKVAGKKRSFDRTVANIHKLQAAGIKLKIKSKILTLNVHELEPLRRFVEDELGLDFNPYFSVYPRLDRTTDHLALRLPPSEIKRLEALYGGADCDSNSELQRPGDPANPNLFRCASGQNTFYINPYGKLNFCNYLRTHSYDLKTGTLLEGVQWLRDELLGREHHDSSGCKTCAIQGSCENCPARAYLATGNMYGRDESLCELNQVMRSAQP